MQENVAGAQIWRSAATSHAMALQYRILFGGRAHPPAGPLVKIEDAPRLRAAKTFMGCLF